MTTLAATLIDWNALWKIVFAALIGGAGVVVVFGLGLLGLERARTARSQATRLANQTVAVACGVLCVAAIAIGIFAMAEKPSSKAVPNPTGPALPAPPHRTG